MKEINFKWIALGILIGYLSPYVIALIKSYQSAKESPQPSSKETFYEY